MTDVTLTSEQVAAARSLQTVPVPRHLSRVAGCTCDGGRDLHRVDCTLWDLPPEQVRAAVEAAEDRQRQFSAALTEVARRQGQP